ncbi:DUF1775 domain-containing protein [Rhabdothermincola salaria]|uniref:DUF1775 domain-containing protein n=1 Tax=Rhabdothermincola salaria TaxID=2903142 RepID=UPI001E53B15E|nr:DUF1775 domain-containing protein [Rhabdothermincola salaria]MCD9624435.1 YcnI family protein [Rhabdothermincola salaria]
MPPFNSSPDRSSPRRHRPTRAVIAALALSGTVALVAPTAPAAAHVTSAEEPVVAGERTPVTFSFDHGCAGQPTTSLRVQIPDGVSDVAAEAPEGWTSTVTDDELRWDGGSIPDGETVPFVATMVVTAPEDTTLHFPTIQGCPTAEEAWIQIPDASNPEPDYPAPSIVVGTTTDATLADEPQGTEAAAATTPTTRPPLEDSPIASREVDRSTSGLIVFIGVMVVIIGGAVVLYLVYRPKRGSSES